VWKLGYSDEAINKTFDALAGIVGMIRTRIETVSISMLAT
jgi:hypothetical protein